MSSSKSLTLALQDFLPYHLSVVTNKVSRNLANLYSLRFDLSIAEWRVMAVLGQEQDLSADEVCNRTETDKVTVSRAVSKLLAKNYLVRRFSRTDRRRSILRLSRRGYGIYVQIVPIAIDYQDRLVQGLSKQEQAQLRELLNKLEQQAGVLALEAGD